MKEWRKDAIKSNKDEGRKHTGRKYKSKFSTWDKANMYPLLSALFKRVGLINNQMPQV